MVSSEELRFADPRWPWIGVLVALMVMALFTALWES